MKNQKIRLLTTLFAVMEKGLRLAVNIIEKSEKFDAKSFDRMKPDVCSHFPYYTISRVLINGRTVYLKMVINGEIAWIESPDKANKYQQHEHALSDLSKLEPDSYQIQKFYMPKLDITQLGMTEPQPKTTFAEAVREVRHGLKNDPELFETYKSNIAMAFVDEYNRSRKVLPVNIVSVANTAAENFLKLWCDD